MQTQEHTRIETIKVEGGQILETVKRLIHEGNVRRIVVTQDERTIAEFPLTVGVVGAALAPALAAVGALAALLTDCSIDIERVEMTEPTPTTSVSTTNGKLPESGAPTTAETTSGTAPDWMPD